MALLSLPLSHRALLDLVTLRDYLLLSLEVDLSRRHVVERSVVTLVVLVG